MNEHPRSVRLPEKLAKDFDAICDKSGLAGSDLMRVAIEQFISRTNAAGRIEIDIVDGAAEPSSSKRGWNVYVTRWRAGHYSVHALAGSIDWLDELDSLGDPSIAEVRRIKPGKKLFLSFDQSRPDSSFDIEVWGSQSDLSAVFNSSDDIVWKGKAE